MNTDKYQYFMGIDVQIKRRCPYLILNHKKVCVSSGWLEGDSKDEICRNLVQLINALENNGIGTIAIGIDAPRVPLSTPRQYFWDGKRNHWKEKSREKGYGRHCEVILKSLKIANPQFTPVKEKCEAWMQLGFALFSILRNREGVFEVFPTASYFILKG